MTGDTNPAVEWTAAEREARKTGRFALVGRADGRGSKHVVWVSRHATAAAYPPEGICDRESWVSFEPLFTAEEVAERERQAAARAWGEGYDAATTMARCWGHTDYWEGEPSNPYEADRIGREGQP